MKTVGKRSPAKGWAAFDKLQKLAMDLGPGRRVLPKGVYRFKTKEEAQAWSLKMTVLNARESHRSKT